MSEQWSLCYHYTATPCYSYSCCVNEHWNFRPFPSFTSHLLRRCRRNGRFRLQCSSDGNSKPARGFGLSSDSNDGEANTDEKRTASRQQRKSAAQQSDSTSSQAPGLRFQKDGTPKNITLDVEFEERLQAVKRSALEQKKAEEDKQYGAIDYDAPVESERGTIGLGTKIGVGVAVVVFGLVFALGDFIPSGSVSPTDVAIVDKKNLSDDEKANLQARMKIYESQLNTSPEDPDALEGAAVTLSELGEYSQAASYLEKLTKKQQNDPDVFRLLGELKYVLKDYEGSAAAYKNSMKVSKAIDFEVLRGLTNALLSAKKPDEAIHFLVMSRERLSKEDINSDGTMPENGATKTTSPVDPIQVELLLGKAYSDWGHVSDAVSVYDQLISSYPNDFRGYLAKGIILKENGNVGDAERMFIQARFFAPEKAKALVDQYSRR